MLGSGLDSQKLAQTIESIDHDEAEPPVLYCQSSEDEFAWVQLSRGRGPSDGIHSVNWIITFGRTLLSRDDYVATLALKTLNTSAFELEASAVAGTLSLGEKSSPEALADFMIKLLTGNNELRDLRHVEVALEYR